jgi:hypothetical protein
MGGLIPTTADNQICSRLNNRFSNAIDPNAVPPGTWLDSVRQRNNAETLFDNNHHLHRLAWRFGAYPDDETSRKRWYFLLRSNASLDALSDSNRDDIKDALNDVMQDPSILQVLFLTEHDGSIAPRFEVDANIGDAPDLPNGGALVRTLTLTLKCRVDQYIPVHPHEPDPPDPDGTEQPPAIVP